MVDGQEGFDDDDVDACLLSIEGTSGTLLLSLNGACIIIHTSARWVLIIESTSRSYFLLLNRAQNSSAAFYRDRRASTGFAELPDCLALYLCCCEGGSSLAKTR